VLEVTGSSREIVRPLEPQVKKMIAVSPADTGISPPCWPDLAGRRLRSQAVIGDEDYAKFRADAQAVGCPAPGA
jgi:hypothetical protein